MSESLPTIYLARHGETAWRISGQHTGSDRHPAHRAWRRMLAAWANDCKALHSAKVFTSPLHASPRTCESAGFGDAGSKSIPIWSNGTTATTREERPPKFAASSRTGNCFATAAPAAKAWSMSDAERIALWRACVRSAPTSCLFQLAFLARPGGSLAGTGAGWRRVFHSQHRHAQCPGLRTQFDEPVIRLWNDARHVGD